MDHPLLDQHVQIEATKSTDLKLLTDFVAEDLFHSSRWKYLVPNPKERSRMLPGLAFSTLKWAGEHGDGDLWEYRIKDTGELVAVAVWLPPNIKMTIPLAAMLSTSASCIGAGSCNLQHMIKYCKKQEKFLRPLLAEIQGWYLYYAATSPKYTNHQDLRLLYGKLANHPEFEKIGKHPVVVKADEISSALWEGLGFSLPVGLNGICSISEDAPVIKLLTRYSTEDTSDIDNIMKAKSSTLSDITTKKESGFFGGKASAQQDDDWASLFHASPQESLTGRLKSSSKLSLLFDSVSFSLENLSPVVSVPAKADLHYNKILPVRAQKNLSYTRTNGNRLSTITILPPTEEWDRKSYYIMAPPELYTTEVSPHKHLCWAVKHKSTSFEGQTPFSLIFVSLKGFFLYWYQLSIRGYKTWSVEMLPDRRFHWLDKDRELSPSTCKKYLKGTLEDASAFREIKITPETTSLIRSIESVRTRNLKTLELGILRVPNGAKTIKELVSNKNIASPEFNSFLPVLGVPAGNFDAEGCKESTWQGLTVKWLVGSQMSKDGRRRRIGNAMCLVLFNDSDKPFDLSTLFLGQVTNFVCVVQQGPTKLGKKTWKLAFFSHYEQKIRSTTSKEEQTAAQEAYIVENLITFPPNVPKNFLFDEISLSEFILTKCFNAIVNASSKHNSVRAQFELPVAKQLQDFVKQVDPEWYSKVSK